MTVLNSRLDDQASEIYGDLATAERAAMALVAELRDLSDRVETRIEQVGRLAASDVETDSHLLALGVHVAVVHTAVGRAIVGLRRHTSSVGQALAGLDAALSDELHRRRSSA